MRIDLHCHLLWDIDDGAQSLEDTLALCETAAANNIRIIVATPHYMDYTGTGDFLYARNRRIAQLNSLLRTRELPVHICGGAEVFLHDGIFEAGDLSPLTLNRSRYLLCEYALQPFDPALALPLAEEVFDRGLVPVIAHPERYPTFHRHPELVADLADMGALFQVTADSVAGKLGDRIRQFAVELLTDGIADLIATDAHHPVRRGNDLDTFIADFPPEIPAALVTYATQTAPQAVLQDADPNTIRHGAWDV